jgi:hypothetical protein
MRVSNLDATVKQLSDEMKAVGMEEKKLDSQEKGHSEIPLLHPHEYRTLGLFEHIFFAPSSKF